MTAAPVPFHSLLFERSASWAETEEVEAEAPAFFTDLNLDQVFASVVAGRDDYRLEPFFRMPLHDMEAVRYRHEIMRDLEGEALQEHVRAFAADMRGIREFLGQAAKLHYEHQKARWFLDAVDLYCAAVGRLAGALSGLDLRSRGFATFRDHLSAYRASEAFRVLVAETAQRRDDLAHVPYCVHIKGKHVTVSRYAGESDYSVEVEKTFRKFRQGAAKSYLVTFRGPSEMNHVEANILDLVARLYPDVFRALRDYCHRHRDFVDVTIRRFDREVQFYLAYLEFMEGFKAAGLHFCYPAVEDRYTDVRADDTFDLALANRLVREGVSVVRNSFHLKDPERVIVVSGPNQGGKTTFARTFGQLHCLAALGLPVPASHARLFLYDRLFTHFEREEHVENLRSKLQDELVRIHEILQVATGDSIIVMNESFSSTTLQDNLFLGTRVLQEIVRRGMLCVYVTFVDELSTLGDAVVSMVSGVEPENPAVRTYKVVRKRADGLAYAAALAAKYGLTYESVRRRSAP